jgi:hypothetical protein
MQELLHAKASLDNIFNRMDGREDVMSSKIAHLPLLPEDQLPNFVMNMIIQSAALLVQRPSFRLRGHPFYATRSDV